MLISFFLMVIISTSLAVQGQPSPRFHEEAWLSVKWTIDFSGGGGRLENLVSTRNFPPLIDNTYFFQSKRLLQEFFQRSTNTHPLKSR